MSTDDLCTWFKDARGVNLCARAHARRLRPDLGQEAVLALVVRHIAAARARAFRRAADVSILAGTLNAKALFPG